MVPFDLPSSIQRYVAVSSIGSSTVRSRPSGTLDAARSFLELGWRDVLWLYGPPSLAKGYFVAAMRFG